MAGATALAQAAPAVSAAAQVLVSEGDTLLVRGNSVSTPVQKATAILSGDRIRTGADGRVQLRFADGALFSIQPGSDFQVEQWSAEPGRERSWFRLARGAVRAVSGRIGKRDPADWRLITPTATIGIRGTEFTASEQVCPGGGCAPGTEPGLEVSVIAGRVSVSNAHGSVEVPAGRTLRLRDARTAPALAGAGATRVQPAPQADPPQRRAYAVFPPAPKASPPPPPVRD